MRADRFGVEPLKVFFARKSVKYIGDILTRDGMRIDPERVRDIPKIKWPETVEDVQQFVDLGYFVGPFVEHLSDRTAAFPELIRKDDNFRLDREPPGGHREFEESSGEHTDAEALRPKLASCSICGCFRIRSRCSTSMRTTASRLLEQDHYRRTAWLCSN